MNNEEPKEVKPAGAGQLLQQVQTAVVVTLENGTKELEFSPASTFEVRPGISFFGITLVRPVCLIYPPEYSTESATKIIGLEKLEAVYKSDMLTGGKLVETETRETLWE